MFYIGQLQTTWPTLKCCSLSMWLTSRREDAVSNVVEVKLYIFVRAGHTFAFNYFCSNPLFHKVATLSWPIVSQPKKNKNIKLNCARDGVELGKCWRVLVRDTLTLRVCLHDNDVQKWIIFLFDFWKILFTNDFFIKMITVHMDLRNNLNCCVIHARPVIGDVTL